MKRIVTSLFQEIHGRPYSLSAPDDEAIIQNTTYLLERLGLHMGEFWFLRDSLGVYSLELSNAIVAEVDMVEESYALSEFAQEQINSVKNILSRGRALGQTPHDWLEIVSSLHFLKNYEVADGDVAAKFVAEKPQYSDTYLTSAAMGIVDVIDELGCYPT